MQAYLFSVIAFAVSASGSVETNTDNSLPGSVGGDLCRF